MSCAGLSPLYPLGLLSRKGSNCDARFGPGIRAGCTYVRAYQRQCLVLGFSRYIHCVCLPEKEAALMLDLAQEYVQAAHMSEPTRDNIFCPAFPIRPTGFADVFLPPFIALLPHLFRSCLSFIKYCELQTLQSVGTTTIRRILLPTSSVQKSYCLSNLNILEYTNLHSQCFGTLKSHIVSPFLLQLDRTLNCVS
jgi:hypothetical protein